VLGELRRLAPQVPASKGVALSERVRPFLESEHQHERRAAMAVLARLGDATAVPRMLELLEHGDAGERREAHEALRTLSACQFPDQVASWRAWYERERVWWEEQAQEAFEQLSSDDHALVLAAVRAVGDRSLRRERLAAELAPLVQHDAPAVRAYACAGLGQLRVPATVEVLVGALDDEEPAVRTQAVRALRAITGKDLPPEREAWSRALDA
jgi:HEAT repeat protein